MSSMRQRRTSPVRQRNDWRNRHVGLVNRETEQKQARHNENQSLVRGPRGHLFMNIEPETRRVAPFIIPGGLRARIAPSSMPSLVIS